MTPLAAEPKREPVRIARDALHDALRMMRGLTLQATRLVIIERAAREITYLGDSDGDAIDVLSGVAIDLHGLDADAVLGALSAGGAAAWEEIYNAGPPPAQPMPEPRDVSESTIEAADHMRRQGDAAALRQWFEDHAHHKAEILERWRNG